MTPLPIVGDREGPVQVWPAKQGAPVLLRREAHRRPAALQVSVAAGLPVARRLVVKRAAEQLAGWVPVGLQP